MVVHQLAKLVMSVRFRSTALLILRDGETVSRHPHKLEFIQVRILVALQK